MSALHRAFENSIISQPDIADSRLTVASDELRRSLLAIWPMIEQTHLQSQSAPQLDSGVLIRRIQIAAQQARASEARVGEQGTRIEHTLQQARDELIAANARATAAEARAQEMQSRAEALISAAQQRVAAAEDRARVAEARAQEAEGWLGRFHDVISSELQELTDQIAA